MFDIVWATLLAAVRERTIDGLDDVSALTDYPHDLFELARAFGRSRARRRVLSKSLRT